MLATSSSCSISSTARPGSRLFHLRLDQVSVPYGVEVAQVVPGTLALELEKSLCGESPVVPALDGEPAPGFEIGPITSEPATVDVIGPESRRAGTVRGDDGAGQGRRPVRKRARRRHGRGHRFGGAAGRAEERDGARRDPAGSGGAQHRRRAGAMAQPRERVARGDRAVGRKGPDSRPRERAEGGPGATISRRSSILPGSDRAGTIFGSRSILPRTTASAPSPRLSSR